MIAKEMDIFKKLWKLNILPKAAMFLWGLFIDRLLSKENLWKRNIIVDENDPELESSKHGIFKCGFAHRVWKECYNWIQVQSALPICPVSHFYQHSLSLNSMSKRGQWDVVCFYKSKFGVGDYIARLLELVEGLNKGCAMGLISR
ncbi:hypothetical protein HKD37_11G030392 [Glycine soja]